MNYFDYSLMKNGSIFREQATGRNFLMRNLFCILLLVSISGALGGQEYIWIEGEKPAKASFE